MRNFISLLFNTVSGSLDQMLVSREIRPSCNLRTHQWSQMPRSRKCLQPKHGMLTSLSVRSSSGCGLRTPTDVLHVEVTTLLARCQYIATARSFRSKDNDVPLFLSVDHYHLLLQAWDRQTSRTELCFGMLLLCFAMCLLCFAILQCFCYALLCIGMFLLRFAMLLLGSAMA